MSKQNKTGEFYWTEIAERLRVIEQSRLKPCDDTPTNAQPEEEQSEEARRLAARAYFRAAPPYCNRGRDAHY